MTGPVDAAGPSGTGVLHYVLTPEDALAWESRSPAVRRRDRVAIAASVFAGIGLIQLIGARLPDLKALHSVPMAFVLIALPMLAVIAMQRRDRRRRVAERVAAPVGVQLEHDAGRVVERREDRRDAVAFGPQALRAVVEGPEHVFLHAGADVIIIPTRAFGTPAAREAFVRHWQAHAD